MNKLNLPRKRIVSVLAVVLLIIALLVTMHLLVNNFDFLGFLKSIHG